VPAQVSIAEWCRKKSISYLHLNRDSFDQHDADIGNGARTLKTCAGTSLLRQSGLMWFSGCLERLSRSSYEHPSDDLSNTRGTLETCAGTSFRGENMRFCVE
jgi:hypothetical protein